MVKVKLHNSHDGDHWKCDQVLHIEVNPASQIAYITYLENGELCTLRVLVSRESDERIIIY